MTKFVSYACDGAVGVVTLSRPRRSNAFNHQMLREFLGALETANADENTKVMLVNALGKNFSVGDDMIAAAAEVPNSGELAEFLATLQNISRALMFNRKPVVAAMQGWVVGGAFSWSLNCDFPIWSSTAKGLLPETKYGIFASGGASFLLADRVGHLRAMEMFFLHEAIDANAMLKDGLILKVVSDEALQDEARSFAHSLTRLSATSLGDYKEALVSVNRERVEAALRNEAIRCVMSGEDSAVRKKLEELAGKLSLGSG